MSRSTLRPRHQTEVDRWDWLHVRDQEEGRRNDPDRLRHPQVRPGDRRHIEFRESGNHETGNPPDYHPVVSVNARRTSPSSPGRLRQRANHHLGERQYLIPSSTSRSHRRATPFYTGRARSSTRPAGWSSSAGVWQRQGRLRPQVAVPLDHGPSDSGVGRPVHVSPSSESRRPATWAEAAVSGCRETVTERETILAT